MSGKTVFISYRRDDAGKAFARSLEQTLTQRGYDVFLDVDSVDAGRWEEQILTQVPLRSHFLLLLTPETLTRCDEPQDWVRREYEFAVRSERNIVPVRSDATDIAVARDACPDSMRSVFAWQIPVVGYDTFVRDVAELVERYIPSHKAPIPKPSPPTATGGKPNNLPFTSLGPLFKGREGFLDKIGNGLRKAGHASAIVGAQAVHGLGGLGKTRAAIEFAWQHKDEYSAVLFVAADTPETLEKSLAELCGPLVLNLPQQDVKEQAVRYAAVIEWLSKHPGWFLILDNVDDERAAAAVEGLLPHLHAGHVLITSRYGEWGGGVERLDLEVLTPAASIALLEERTKGRRRIAPDDAASVAALAQELDGLPLALEQAGAFLVAKGESFGGYLSRWKAREAKVRTWHDATRMKYPRSIAVTWDTSFDQLDPAARSLLNMLSWYAPDPIPVAVWQTEAAEQAIADGAQRLADNHNALSEPGGVSPRFNPPSAAAADTISRTTPELGDTGNVISRTSDKTIRGLTPPGSEESSNPPRTDPIDAEEARAGLSRYGLIKWTPDLAAFSVHRLVQEVTRERLDDTESTASLQSGLDVLDAYLPADPPAYDVRSWPLWTPVRVHTATLIEHADQHVLANPTTRLMNGLGVLLHTKGLWNEAEPLYRRALAIDEQHVGHVSNVPAPSESEVREAQTNVAICLNNLAQLLKATNRLSEAEPLMRRALAIDEQSYGVEHPNVAIDLNNLAQLLQATNRLAEAEPLMRRALAIDEQSYGAEHPNVAIRLSTLAALFYATNRLAEAEPLMRRALALAEQSYGAEHPKVALRLNNLAMLLRDTNRLAEAEPLMRRALAIDEQSYGTEHPRVATDLNNLAQLLKATNRLAEAEPLMRRALDIFRASLGDEHPHTLTVARNYDILRAEMTPGEPK